MKARELDKSRNDPEGALDQKNKNKRLLPLKFRFRRRATARFGRRAKRSRWSALSYYYPILNSDIIKTLQTLPRAHLSSSCDLFSQ